MQVKVSLINSLYQKTLGLSTAARQKKSVGETVTLMQVDAVKVGDVMPFLHGVWSGLLQVGLTVGLLVNFIGSSALVGITLILFTFPLQTAIVNRMIACQKDIMTHTSERVKVLNEVIQGIRVVKSSAWERPFKASVEESRAKELKAILKRVVLRATHVTLMLSTPLLIMVATFAFYTKVQRRQLIPSTIFTAVSLFTALRNPLMMYPMVVNNLISAHISVKRIDAFLKLDDVKLVNRQASHTSDAASSDNDESDGKKPLCAIEIEGDFQWITLPPDSKKSKSSKAGKGSSAKSSDSAVVGPVGSGKSSFVSALLGDMEQKKGPPIVIRGSLAYCSQQAWIMNATVRDNILFGKEFDEITYDAVLSACALEQDLEALPNGDLTEIGERGINLSGGQKQRVSLARAVYADADIYVLDDPLSAVDAHVGAHLFHHCINGSLANKTRVFVTNQLQFVPEADSILIMKEGRTVQQGTYKELMKLGTDFSQLMKGSGADKADNTSEDAPESDSKGGALKKKESSDKLKGSAKQQANKKGAAKVGSNTGYTQEH
ncbi:hypothetical protein CBR_g50697 [Chara braunii]|uniref:Uncharacterized protein n=1 Tax=Chara braunii TaxID=69332 RepID=A0A388K5J6_CHABU|nr:hypothetical protein CBR_g50697 [Chara braunii]|eukprot:GBG65334.1 hypothetical protein CBR_g50697 [Chara braunii]